MPPDPEPTRAVPGEPEARILADAERAFERGDYAQVRASLRGLLAGAPSEGARRDAEALLGRTAPDRAAVILALA